MLSKLYKLRRLFPKRPKAQFALILFLMLIGTVLEVVSVGAVPAFLAVMVDPESVLKLPAAGTIFKWLDITTSKEILIYSGIGLLFIYLIKNAYLSFLSFIKTKYIRDQIIRLGRKLFTTYMHAPYAFHLKENTAELMRNANLEVRLIGNQVLKPLLQLILNGIMAISIIVLLLIIQPFVSILVVLILGISSLLFMRLTRHKIEDMGEQEQTQRTASYKVMNEGFGSLKALKISNKEDYFEKKFSGIFGKANYARFVKEFVSSLTRPFMEVIAVVGMLIVAFSVIILDQGVQTLIPTLGLFGVAIIRLQGSITTAVSNFTMLKYNVYAIDPVYKDLNRFEELQIEEVKEFTNQKNNSLFFRQEITVESLCFKYEDTRDYLLQDIHLSIPKEASVGIVGPTGAGKSTLIDLLLGLLTPTKGHIRVDGKNIFSNIHSWQSKIGYIPQDIYLLDDSIKRNVALGVEDEAIDENRLKTAVELAQIDDFVNALSQGWDTETGERGVRLSGGQLQRVGIARALYNNPDVLVMDEATSSLDTATERSVMEALNSAKKGRTFIMIAHRLSTVKNCDIIYFLKQGQVVSSGTYANLMESSKEFRTMVAEHP